jgi:Domain of unknown function (DUF4145)
MSSRLCPHCRVKSHFTSRSRDSIWIIEDQWEGKLYRFLETCDNCEMPVCGTIGDDEDSYEQVWPAGPLGKDYPDVPTPIGNAASEAHGSLASGAVHASVIMARAVIEATAKEKGIAKGSLEFKIKQLAEHDLISEAMKSVADEIRLAGNDAAHGDFISEEISAGDAEEIVTLMDSILERVYQEPARVERVRASRQKRHQRAERTERATTDSSDS